jgi:hypothetical protein
VSDPPAAEQAETFLTRPGLRVEWIVSPGQGSPTGSWFDQAVAGAAKLRIADEPKGAAASQRLARRRSRHITDEVFLVHPALCFPSDSLCKITRHWSRDSARNLPG